MLQAEDIGCHNCRGKGNIHTACQKTGKSCCQKCKVGRGGYIDTEKVCQGSAEKHTANSSGAGKACAHTASDRDTVANNLCKEHDNQNKAEGGDE